MLEIRLYRAGLVVSLFLYVSYYFAPYSYGFLSPDVAGVLSYSGYGAIWPGNDVWFNALLVAWCVTTFGMFFFSKVARAIFAFLLIVSMAMTPLYGVSVELAGVAMLFDLSNVLVGYVLAMAFFSPQIKRRFDSGRL